MSDDEREGSAEEEMLVRDEDDVLRRAHGPERIGAAVGAVVERRRWSERLRGAAVFRAWPEIVGEELAERCEPVRLAGGVLVVRAESSAWATQLSYLAGRIVERAQALLGEGLVREVRITVGPLPGVARDPECGGSGPDQPGR